MHPKFRAYGFANITIDSDIALTFSIYSFIWKDVKSMLLFEATWVLVIGSAYGLGIMTYKL